MKVRDFDEIQAKEAVKKCHKIVRDYVALLENDVKAWKDVANEAVKKLRQQ
jgi:hypothetical protein